MDLFQIVVLALVQGLTEFLPISSSAHLILPKEILGWPDQGLAFDVAVHVGSLAAVMIYFRNDIFALTGQWLRSLFRGDHTDGSRLAWFVIIGTIPTGLAGLLLNDYVETYLRSSLVIMIATIVFGLYLGLGDWKGKRNLSLNDLTLKMAIIIGISQAVALIPGTSRSGITMATALFFGLQRDASARFSFLLSIPIIILSGLFEGVKLVENNQLVGPDTWRDIFLGIALSVISAYACIHYFLRFIQQIGMWPFVIYRLLLGLGLGLMIWLA